MSGLKLAGLIERDLVGAVRAELHHYFSNQLRPGRQAIVGDDAAEVEVRFAIREARLDSTGAPDAYLVLRELRTDAAPNRPNQYWYGLNQRLATGVWLYEAFHRHDEGLRGVVAHFQSEVKADAEANASQVEWHETTPVHVVTAVERLMPMYYKRLAAEDAEEI